MIMLESATTVMFVGMSVVFMFLLLIVGLINAISFVLKYFPESARAQEAACGLSPDLGLEKIAVVIAAAKSLSERK